MRALKNFFLYNNTVPIVLGVIFLSAGVTFAANEDAREAIIDSEERLTSVDNTFIRNVNLNTFAAEVYVDRIEEDALNYYVYYVVATIDVVDGQWQPVTKNETLEIDKESLGENDLGILVSKELSDIYNAEMRRLSETQEIEKTIGQTNKVITTEYDGIVGRMLDPQQQAFPGYSPVNLPPQDTSRPASQFEEELDNGETVVVENRRNENSAQTNPDADQEPLSDPNETATTTSPVEPGDTATSTDPVEQPAPEPVATSTPTETGEVPTEPENVEEEPAPEPVEATQQEPEEESTPETVTEPENTTSAEDVSSTQ